MDSYRFSCTRRWLRLWSAALLVVVLSACGGGDLGGLRCQINGLVFGLKQGSTLVLVNNGTDTLSITHDGYFTFGKPIPHNGSYLVTVKTQPAGQLCTVTNGFGWGIVSDVLKLKVTCSAAKSYTIGGSVTGLATGGQLSLLDNGADALTIAANGKFVFATPVAANSSYAVIVAAQPAGQTCTVSNGSGAGVVANISNVAVTCSTNTFSISGSVNGLASGQQVTLLDNNADPLILSANGSFSFATPVAYNSSYAVTVGTQPDFATCSVSNGSGSGVVANVSNVAVTCALNSYTVAGSVMGLTSGQQVTLNNNGSDPVTVAADGSFAFATPVPYGGSYAVTIGTQPIGETCSVTNGNGANMAANVGNVAVSCVVNTFKLSVAITGLDSSQQLTLLNNGADALIINGSTTNSFSVSFASNIAYNGAYAVSINSQPGSEICTLSNGTGSGVIADVTSVRVTCHTVIIYNLKGGLEGTNFMSGLVQGQDSDNAFYTTSNYGGTLGYGTIVKITPDGTSTVLHDFDLPDGIHPYATLIFGPDGNLYGTTNTSGAVYSGAVYKISPAGNFTVLHFFNGGTDGGTSMGGLLLATDGNFYGTTSTNGSGNQGTIYQITPAGNFSVLHTLTGAEGSSPYGSLIQANDGNLYGTTKDGGTFGSGSVFKITLSGNFTSLYSFAGGTDGASPRAGVIQAKDGNLYGTTMNGGATNKGTVYKLTLSGTETVLHAFDGSIGSNPESPLSQAASGIIYGTTDNGGANNGGTLFAINPQGITTLIHSFDYSTGDIETTGVINGKDGSLYGICMGGGVNGNGAIFKF